MIWYEKIGEIEISKNVLESFYELFQDFILNFGSSNSAVVIFLIPYP